MFKELRREISFERVDRDLRGLLHQANWQVEIGGESVHVDRSLPLQIVGRSCHAYEYDMGFGDHYRVLVAVGGVRAVENGVVRAATCFASMYYGPALAVITVDFARAMP
jgi:hypothetical protein